MINAISMCELMSRCVLCRSLSFVQFYCASYRTNDFLLLYFPWHPVVRIVCQIIIWHTTWITCATFYTRMELGAAKTSHNCTGWQGEFRTPAEVKKGKIVSYLFPLSLFCFMAHFFFRLLFFCSLDLLWMGMMHKILCMLFCTHFTTYEYANK